MSQGHARGTLASSTATGLSSSHSSSSLSETSEVRQGNNAKTFYRGVPDSQSSFPSASHSPVPSTAPVSDDDYLVASYEKMLAMTLELVQDTYLNIRPGDSVLTSFGKGKLITIQNGGTMKIQLSYGLLYCPTTHLVHKLLTSEEYEKAMEHLEQSRKLQLAIQFIEWGIDFDSKTDACVACLFRKPEICTSKRQRRPYWRRSSSKKLSPNSNINTKTQRCDVCGNPVCSQHKIAMGGDHEYFVMCVDCSHDLNQASQNYHAHHPQLLQNLQRLVQYYTRMSVQLCFCVPNLRQLGQHLTTKQMRDGAVSLGNSAIGFVGAALGVAGAAAMLTPAGPAILLAAVTMSATSGTVQGVYTTYNLFSNKTAHQLADRCLGWHGLCLGILNALTNVRLDLIKQQNSFEAEQQQEYGPQNTVHQPQQSLDLWNALAVGSFTTTRSAMTGVGVTSAMGASYSQAISTGLQGIPVVGAAFSVGCMAMDASTMAASFQLLNTPAKKAVALQGVEHSFPLHVPNSIGDEVDMIRKAVDDLHLRMAKHRRKQERDLIQLELDGLGSSAPGGSYEDDDEDDDIERELRGL